MNLKDYQTLFYSKLDSIYPRTEMQTFFALLLEEYTGLQRIDVVLTPERELKDQTIRQFERALMRLKKHEPIQYIIGETEFYGLPFKVDKNVLIPRPETEELVRWILEEEKNSSQTISILDIGTGSGCISISLKKNWSNAAVSAIDISEDALKVARENARQNKVELFWEQMNILNPNLSSDKFDLIVSNPPYVRLLEKAEMQPNVLDYEPHLALFVKEDDALLFYRKILDFAEIHLSQKGRIYFEVNEFLKDDLSILFQEKGWSKFDFKTDGFGKTRMARLKRE